MKRLIIPQKFQGNFIIAKDIFNEWYLVAKELFRPGSRNVGYEAYKYDSTGRIDTKRDLRLKKESFGF
uniref:hypothetical protein n=1 Tax=Fulvivirga sp. TaxID=1931237 RepID=UPI00404AB6CF